MLWSTLGEVKGRSVCSSQPARGGQSASWNVRLSATLPHPQTVSKGDNFDLGFCMEEKRIDRHQQITFATFLRQFSNVVHNLIAHLISSCVLMYFTIFNCQNNILSWSGFLITDLRGCLKQLSVEQYVFTYNFQENIKKYIFIELVINK